MKNPEFTIDLFLRGNSNSKIRSDYFLKKLIERELKVSKFLRIKSKYKQKWYEEVINNIYMKSKFINNFLEKGKFKIESESGFNYHALHNIDIMQGSYIGGIKSLKLAYIEEVE